MDKKALNIAIIGMSIKLPDADDGETFWKNLALRKNSIKEVSSERWSSTEHFSEQIPFAGKTYCKWAGFIDELYQFDASYFRIPKTEIEQIDMSQLLFLEVVNNLLDGCGYGAGKLSGQSIGVYVGASNNPSSISADQFHQSNSSGMHRSIAMIANRVSTFFNLRGPSKVIDTICSSTLVAIHDACRGIQYGECSAAIVGGINLLTAVEHFILLSQMQVLSPSRQTKPFDAQADGFLLGEGAGAFLLKPLSQATQDRDQILGVIKGVGVNHSGYSENSMLPKAEAITSLLSKTWQSYGIIPENISFIESSGVASPLGDPIEISGMVEAFQEFTAKKSFCALGTLKSNLGNLESAAGVASLAKVLMAFQKDSLPGSCNFSSPNPLIKFEDTPFFISRETGPWVSPSDTKMAGINCFGIGGTNAHLVIEEPPQLTKEMKREPASPALYLLCLSAKSEGGLRKLCQSYATYLQQHGTIDLHDFCYTHNTGRSDFSYRLALWAPDKTTLIQVMGAFHEEAALRENSLLLQYAYFHHVAPAPKPKKQFFRSFLTTLSKGSAASFGEPERQYPITLYLPEITNKYYQQLPSLLNQHGCKIGRTIQISSALGIQTSDLQGEETEPIFIFCAFREPLSQHLERAVYYDCSSQIEAGQPEYIRLLARLYSWGAPIDFEAYYASWEGNRVSLPIYPYDKKTFSSRKSNCLQDKSQPFPMDHLFKLTKDQSLQVMHRELERSLSEAFCYILGLEKKQFDLHQELHTYGIASLELLKISRLIENKINIRLNPDVFLSCRSSSDLAASIAKNYQSSGGSGQLPSDISCHREKSVELIKAQKEHYSLIKSWLADPEIHQWFDPVFQKDIGIKDYSFFLRKKDRITFLIQFEQQAVGMGGLINLDQTNQSAEAWMVIVDERAKSQGLALVAGQMLCQRAFADLNIRTLISKIREDNHPSIEMAKCTSWRFAGTLEKWIKYEGKYYNTLLFQLDLQQFEEFKNKQLL